jgi:hypothetical protein
MHVQTENGMKSLATTFLIFVTCIVVAWTDALIDRAQVTLSASPGGDTQLAARVTDTRGAVTLVEFARIAQEQLRLAQPRFPVVFDDLRPTDPEYAPAQALYPFLHRRLLCPECPLTSSFSAKNPAIDAPNVFLTRAQAAVILVSILMDQGRISLLTREQTADVLAGVPDVDSVSVFARPYIATAIAAGILALDARNMVRPAQPYSHTEMNAAFNTIQRRLPPSTATASLHFIPEARR